MTEARRSALAAVAACRPLAISSPSIFPLASLDDAVRTLLRDSTTHQREPPDPLHADLLTLQQPPVVVAFLSPLFRASALLLLSAAPSTSSDEADFPRVERLWRLLRNHCRSEAEQSALLDDQPAFDAFIAALSSIALPLDAVDHQRALHSKARAALLTTGGQLLVNSLQRHPLNQRRFLSTHLLSPPFIRLLTTPLRPFRATLLHAVHSLILEYSQHEDTIAHPQAVHLLLAIINPMPSSPSASPSLDEEVEEEEEEDDAEMFAASILQRGFLRRPGFMGTLLPALDLASSSSPLLVRVLNSLPEQKAESSSSAAVDSVTPLTANCALLLPLLSSHYPLSGSPSSPAPTDDSAGYLALPSTLCVTPFAHAVIRAVDHALYTTVTHPSSPAPLLATLSSSSHAYLLLALLRSPAVHFGFHSDLLRLLSFASSYPGHHLPFPVLHALSFLNHTRIDDTQPLQREYAVVGLRAVCQVDSVQAELRSLQALEVQGKEEWEQRGVDLQFDADSNRVHVQASDPSRTAKRTSGPIDWGITRPWTTDDFM